MLTSQWWCRFDWRAAAFWRARQGELILYRTCDLSANRCSIRPAAGRDCWVQDQKKINSHPSIRLVKGRAPLQSRSFTGDVSLQRLFTLQPSAPLFHPLCASSAFSCNAVHLKEGQTTAEVKHMSKNIQPCAYLAGSSGFFFFFFIRLRVDDGCPFLLW